MLWLGIAIAFTMVWWPLLNSVCCILLAGYWLFFLPKKKADRQTLLLILLFVSLYVISVAGFFYSENISEAVFRLQIKLPLLLFPVVFGYTGYLPQPYFKQVILAFSISFVLFCWFSFFKAAFIFFNTGDTSVFFGYDILLLKNIYPSAASLYAVFVITMHLIQIRTKNANRFYCITAVFTVLVFLFLLGNRMGLLLSIVMIFYNIWMYLTKLYWKLTFSLILIACLLLGLSLNIPLQKKVKNMFTFSNEAIIPLDTDETLARSWDGKALRIAIWRCASDIIRSNFTVGVGTGDAQVELQKAYEQRKFYFASRYNRYDAHNQYIQQWIMNGIVGVLLLCLALIAPFFFSVLRTNSYYIFFLVIFGLFCITESMLEINKGIVWYSFFNSIFVFSGNKLNQSHYERNKKTRN
jgi:O-antigen ligase